jgi:hypothetical protein
MALKMAASVVQAMLDAFETNIGVSAIVKLRTGAPPSACSGADTGTVCATINLASDWMANAAAGGTKAFSSLPLQDLSADNAGTIGHFRLYKSDGTTCVFQGTVATSGGDMTIDNATVTAGQQINITAWTLDMSAYI